MQRSVEINRKKIQTPFFVPSISGVTLSRIPDLSPHMIESIKRTNFNSLMFSIYDLRFDVNLIQWSKLIFQEGYSIHRSLNLSDEAVIFLDSGGFEAGRYGELETWDDPLEVYSSQLLVKGDAWVILDKPTNPKLDKEENVKRIEKTIEFARQVSEIHSGDITLIACAHGYDKKSLLHCVAELLKFDKISGIAIPARREPFHEGPIGRYESIIRIKKMLQATRPNVFLHLLGCGSLRKWPLYALCGADSFDATDWLVHMAHPTELTWKRFSVPNQITCTCEECRKNAEMTLYQICNYSPLHRLCHNLWIAKNLVKKIQENIQEGIIQHLAQEYQPKEYARLNASIKF